MSLVRELETVESPTTRNSPKLCIFGLESQVELNDVLCTAVALDPDAGRVEVTLEDGKSARVRPSNLRAKYEACDLVRRGAKPPLS